MGTTTKAVGHMTHLGSAAVSVEPFDSLLETEEGDRRLVTVKVSRGMVDMFGREYPRKFMVWVHHFDDYGVIVEGTYEAHLAKKALKKAGYDADAVGLWGWRPLLVGQEPVKWPRGVAVGGRASVAFYFDVGGSLG